MTWRIIEHEGQLYIVDGNDDAIARVSLNGRERCQEIVDRANEQRKCEGTPEERIAIALERIADRFDSLRLKVVDPCPAFIQHQGEPEQRCIRDAGHSGSHRGNRGYEW